MTSERWGKLCNVIRKSFGVPESDEPLPDLMEMEKPNKETGSVLYTPKNMQGDTGFLAGWVSYKVHYTTMALLPFQTEYCPVDSSPFEVNMVEALVGWRAWKTVAHNACLRSQNEFELENGRDISGWYPEVAMIGECAKGENHAVPAEFCTCGIYAKDTLDVLEENYSGIYGQVYGWGRYVRGDLGWRAQFAYPKNFYLTRNYSHKVSPDTIELLKKFHVPIYVEQPGLLYDPKEDGYDGHGNNEENWYFRAAEDSDAEED